LILIAAVVVGALSAFLVFNYVSSADDRALGKTRTVDVIKVAADIPQGTTGQEAEKNGQLVHARIQAEFKPITAINDVSIVANRVAITDFHTGQILVEGMFADPVDSQITFGNRVQGACGPVQASTGAALPCTAITITVDQTRGVAGVIVPGDLVNILVVPDTGYCKKPDDKGIVDIEGQKGSVISKLDPGPQPPLLPDGGVALCNPARYLYQAVKVLFVDKSAIPRPGEVNSTGASTANGGTGTATTVNSGLITLQVPAVAAQVIASVAPDEIYLTLVAPDYKPTPMPKLDPYPAVLPGEDPTQLTPYGPQGIPAKK
jgi:hypothetical protein